MKDTRTKTQYARAQVDLWVRAVGSGQYEGKKFEGCFGGFTICDGEGLAKSEYARMFAALEETGAFSSPQWVLKRIPKPEEMVRATAQGEAEEAERNGQTAPQVSRAPGVGFADDDFVDVDFGDVAPVAHAPGPWFVGTTVHGGPRVETAKGECVAIINANHRSAFTAPIRAANCRLCAAAPELFAVIEAGLEGCDDWEAMARAVLAKARGEE